MKRLTVLLALLPLSGCGSNLGSEPKTPQEKAVANFIVERLNKAGGIYFEEWGPHFLFDEMAEKFGKSLEPRQNTDVTAVNGYIRVRYRAKDDSGDTQSYDRLFAISKQMSVQNFEENKMGATYLDHRFKKK